MKKSIYLIVFVAILTINSCAEKAYFTLSYSPVTFTVQPRNYPPELITAVKKYDPESRIVSPEEASNGCQTRGEMWCFNGDFNNDSIIDYAAELIKFDKKDNTVYLDFVVFLKDRKGRLTPYKIVDWKYNYIEDSEKIRQHGEIPLGEGLNIVMCYISKVEMQQTLAKVTGRPGIGIGKCGSEISSVYYWDSKKNKFEETGFEEY